jgi:glyoxylase-like metal-dependent hydrolase (beta-lactamase superfamily II)
MRIGPWRVETLMTGRFALDGGAMFGVVPRVLWERAIPPDARHRIPLALRSLLLRADDGRTVLVDTGIGATKWSDKERAIYAIDHREHELVRSLAARGVAVEDVTDVLLTHLHFDHAGGATTQAHDGTLRPTFPRATHWLQRRNLAWAQQPTERDRASYLARDYQPLLDAGLLALLDDGEALPLEAITLVVSDGHTEAQQLPLIGDGERTLLYGGDVIPTSAHVPVPWVMGYDVRPLGTVADKQALLPRAAAEGWIVVYEHDPSVAATRVVETERGFAAGPALELGELGELGDA